MVEVYISIDSNSSTINEKPKFQLVADIPNGNVTHHQIFTSNISWSKNMITSKSIHEMKSLHCLTK